MLVPTDAALGNAVISNESVPDKMRQALHAESGLNDGICVPILFLFIALAQDTVNEAVTALACFATAQYFGGSGFIAAFSGGLLFGILEKNLRKEFLQMAEGSGDMLALITWVVFGAVVAGRVIDDLSRSVLLYSILSLTVIRMLPVFLALSGSGVSTEGKLFIGWFGPRGLASIAFAIIVLSGRPAGYWPDSYNRGVHYPC